LQDWNLPEAFATLRRLLEARMGKPGKREYVQVLRLRPSGFPCMGGRLTISRPWPW
jgi:hypothetical protein